MESLNLTEEEKKNYTLDELVEFADLKNAFLILDKNEGKAYKIESIYKDVFLGIGKIKDYPSYKNDDGKCTLRDNNNIAICIGRECYNRNGIIGGRNLIIASEVK